MERELTKQDILELFEQQSKNLEQQSKNLEQQTKNFEQQTKNFEQHFEQIIIRQRLEAEKRHKESDERFDKQINKSKNDFDKLLGQLAGTWGKFVAEMVKPKIVELFKEKGIQIRTSLQNVEGYIGDERYYEIDLLLINSDFAVAVEVKSSLSVEDVKEHLERLEKICNIQPERVNLSGVTIYGAVAGMIVENDADRYAYKKGLFVLRQNGNVVEIVNDSKFKPREWKPSY